MPQDCPLGYIAVPFTGLVQLVKLRVPLGAALATEHTFLRFFARCTACARLPPTTNTYMPGTVRMARRRSVVSIVVTLNTGCHACYLHLPGMFAWCGWEEALL